MVTMDDLPDEMLVHVLSFVETEMLVRELRTVCWRWRSLALHPHVWRDRSVSCYVCGFLLMRVLALAPLLNSLEIYPTFVPREPSPTRLKELVELAGATSCAVRCLTLAGARSPHLDLMSRVLLRQAELGRLRQLSLHVKQSGGSQLRRMLEAVADLDLELLSLDTDLEPATQDAIPTASAGRWGKGTLKNLELSMIESDPLFEFVVTHRAESLESVDFKGIADGGFPSAPWVAALAGCSKLKYASVPAVPEAAGLAACPSLTHLVITSYFGDTVTEAAAAQLSAALASPLARARQVTRLEFKTWNCDYPFMTGVNVVQLLAQRGASRLEDLSLPPIREASELGEELLLALSGLPRLHTLRLHTLRLHSLPPAGFLHGLAASVAPRLTLLELNEDRECARLRLVMPVREAVLRSPRLHVVTRCCGSRCPLGASEGVFGHNPWEDCGVAHDSSVDWEFLSG